MILSEGTTDLAEKECAIARRFMVTALLVSVIQTEGTHNSHNIISRDFGLGGRGMWYYIMVDTHGTTSECDIASGLVVTVSQRM